MKSNKILLILVLSLILACCATQAKKIQKKENDAQYEYEKAVLTMNYGLVDEAIKYLNRALSLNPNHHLSYYLLGLAYVKKQSLAEAEAAIQKCLELKPDFSEAHISLGEIYEDTSKLDKAEDEYKKAYAVAQNYSTSFHLAMLYYGRGKLDQALEYVQKAIQKDSRSIQAYNLQGVILNKLGRYPESIQSFQSVLKIDPNYAVASVNLAIAYINNKNFDKARELLEKTLPTVQDQKLKEKIQEYLEKIKELIKDK
jgi:tetratricopeptide (TPR) repeat protein